MNKHRAQTRKTPSREIPVIRAESTRRAETLQALAHRVERLEHDVQLARGTREIPQIEVPDTTAKLMHDVETVLSQRPLTFRELMAALGLGVNDENRVKGVLVRLQAPSRGRLAVVNLGNGARALWWIDVHDRIGQIAAARR